MMEKDISLELKKYIGKVVISSHTKNRFLLYQITAPSIMVVTEKPDSSGHHTFYSYKTINGDPISNGDLMFEDQTLTKPFLETYKAHCRSEDGYWEEYGYWMRRD